MNHLAHDTVTYKQSIPSHKVPAFGLPFPATRYLLWNCVSFSRIQETDISRLILLCITSCRYSPVGVYFQTEAWCYWSLLFTNLYTSRSRGNLIYFFTNGVSLNQTATNQVKGKVYKCMKRKYINRIPGRCVGVEQCDRWAGDVSFYTLSPNWVGASPPLHVQCCAPSDRLALLWSFCGGRTHPWMHRAGSETLFITNIPRLTNTVQLSMTKMHRSRSTTRGFQYFLSRTVPFRLSSSSVLHIVGMCLSKDWSIKDT